MKDNVIEMNTERKIVEPFVRYPESVIDSKKKAIKVIMSNCYYFYVIGFFTIISGALLIHHDNSLEDISFGFMAIFTGGLYVVLAYLTFLMKSRITCFALAGLLIYSVIVDGYQNDFGGLLLFKLILCLAMYRMVKAVLAYNYR